MSIDEKLVALKDYLATFDLEFALGQVIKPATFNRIIERIGNASGREEIMEQLLRTQMQARYDPERLGHFGLALATKHNAFFLPVVLTPFGVLAAWRAAGEEGRRVLLRMGWATLAFVGYAALLLVVKGRTWLVESWQPLSPQTFGVVALVAGLVILSLQLRRRDAAAFVRLAPLVSMGLIGPVVFFVHWPWLWYHPVDRLAWYFEFHATHVHYASTYFDTVLRAG